MKLSVVVPVYNGEDSICRLVDELHDSFRGKVELEVVLVNDFSKDNSWKKLVELNKKYQQSVISINLGKNSGEHNAVMAGYNHATGDYIANIDDDFQNPPEEILKLLEKIREGYDVVYSYYDKKKHHPFRNLGSQFNDLMATMMLKKPKGLYLCSFRIITKALKNEVVKYTGPYPYIDGLILRSTSHIGKELVSHNERVHGESNYTLVKLIRLWSYMFFNFSVLPLRVSMILGLAFSILGVLGALAVIVEKVLYPSTPAGWSSLMVVVLVLAGVQLITLGVIGEYVGRIFLTQSNTPQYVVKERLGS